MSTNGQVCPAPDRILSVHLAREPLRIPVERLVSEHIGRQWVVREARDMTEYASHPSSILSDGSYSVFAKFSQAANGLHQFEVELASLRLLRERAGVLIPTPIGIVPVTGGSILVLEAVREAQRAPRHWRQIGQTLARIHRNRWDQFGLERNGYIGPLYLDNTPMGDWPTFYAERRLQPYLRSATESGHLPPELVRQVEKLISRLPRLCGPEPAPTLLHGDAQSNNFISTDEGTVVIDPAVCYGHPEMDLAFIGVWLPAVPDDVYDGYRDEQPIDPGFWERRDLWRVWVYLAAVTVEGPSYLDRLTEAVEKYV